MSIRKLSPDLVSLIAAGEVVERPANVIKELVENALDAKASRIVVTVAGTDCSTLSVIDNGQGISPNELSLALELHTTSKISDAADIAQITTFGFRGEALASIAQISNVTIQSRQINTHQGWVIRSQFGNQSPRTSIGMPRGTHVLVEDLFGNQPARKKFLKSPQTELRHITQLILKIGLANPQVHISLFHQDRELIDLLPSQPTERISQVLSPLVDSLLPIHYQGPYLSFEGFIGKPHLAKANQPHQYLYVNNRAVKLPALQAVVTQAFGSRIAKGYQPAYVLFLTVPPELVDCNIHPQKTEVKLARLNEAREILEAELAKLLNQEILTYEKTYESPYKLESHSEIVSTKLKLQDSIEHWITKVKQAKDSEISQINLVYLAVSTEKGLLLIDQHAAHERILYEQYLGAFTDHYQSHFSSLETPINLHLTLPESQLVTENQPYFSQLGFTLTSLNDTSWLVSTIPSILEGRKDIKQVLAEIIANLLTDTTPSPVDNLSHTLIKYLACKNAIKAGDYLEPAERKRLIDKLLECENQYTCPHGRPAQVLISTKQLAGLFHRS